MKIVQCWDDGVVDDVRLIEILRKYGAKASFNLNIGLHKTQRYTGWKFQNTKEVWKLSLDELTDVYSGFLVANHTVSHPCLTQVSPERMKKEIVEGRKRLEQLFGYAVTGFAYPCGDYNSEVEAAVRDAGHLYARTTKSVTPSFPPAEAMALHADCHFLDPEFWLKYEKAKSLGSVFYFWGHSYELISEDDWQAFDAKVARLSRDGEWANLPDLFR